MTFEDPQIDFNEVLRQGGLSGPPRSLDWENRYYEIGHRPPPSKSVAK